MFEAIPAIDILDGKVVRLKHGDYSQVTYYGNPEYFARKWELAGAKTIHIVDLDGAKSGKPVNLETIRRIRESIKCQVQLGGGIRTEESLVEILSMGIDRVILGSIVLKNRPLTETLLKKYGGERIMVSIDTLKGKAAAEGWLETSDVSIPQLIKTMENSGVKNIIYTDISRDGALQGPNLAAYKSLVKKTKVGIIASGGISGLKDIQNLKKIKGLGGVIVGRALYENKVMPEEIF